MRISNKINGDYYENKNQTYKLYAKFVIIDYNSIFLNNYYEVLEKNN